MIIYLVTCFNILGELPYIAYLKRLDVLLAKRYVKNPLSLLCNMSIFSPIHTNTDNPLHWRSWI